MRIMNNCGPRTSDYLLLFVFMFTLFLPISTLGQPAFIRGDSNGDKTVDLADVIHMLFYLFLSEPVDCLEAVDTDDNSILDITDALTTLGFLFLNQPKSLNLPGQQIPWTDPTPDNLGCLFSGMAVVGQDGGIATGRGVELEAQAGAFEDEILLEAKILKELELQDLLDVGLPLMAILAINIGIPESSEHGLMALPGIPLILRVLVSEPDGLGVLIQSIIYEEQNVLSTVSAVSISNGIATTTDAFPGILTSGLYAFYKINSGLIVSGTAEWDDGDPVSGALVKNSANGLSSITDISGCYWLPPDKRPGGGEAQTTVSIFDSCTGRTEVSNLGEKKFFSCPRACRSFFGLVNGSFEDGDCLCLALPNLTLQNSSIPGVKVIQGFDAEVFASGIPQMKQPLSVVFEPQGTILVGSNEWVWPIIRLSRDGSFLRQSSNLSDPDGVALDTFGRIFVAGGKVVTLMDSINGGVDIVYDSGFYNLNFIAISSNNRMIVSENDGRIYEIVKDSAGLVSHNQIFNLGRLSSSIAFDSRDRLFLGRYSDDSVLLLENGNVRRINNNPIVDPAVITFGPGGLFGKDIFVKDIKGNILILNEKTGNHITFATGFSGGGDITFDGINALYVSQFTQNSVLNRIIRISPSPGLVRLRVPGWESKEEAEIVERHFDILPKYGRYMVKIPLTSEVNSTTLLKQTFQMPPEVRALFCDICVIPEDKNSFGGEITLSLSSIGVTDLKETLVLTGQPGFIPFGFKADSINLKNDQIEPFRGKQVTLTLSGIANKNAIILIDGFRYCKEKITSVIIKGKHSCTEFDENMIIANKIYQQIGIVFEKIDCKEFPDPNYVELDHRTNEETQLYNLYGTNVPEFVDVFYVDKLIGFGRRNLAVTQSFDTGRFIEKKVMISTFPVKSNQQEIVLSHELGHTLNLDHVLGKSFWMCRSLFKPCEVAGDKFKVMYYAPNYNSQKLNNEEARKILLYPNNKKLLHE